MLSQIGTHIGREILKKLKNIQKISKKVTIQRKSYENSYIYAKIQTIEGRHD